MLVSVVSGELRLLRYSWCSWKGVLQQSVWAQGEVKWRLNCLFILDTEARRLYVLPRQRLWTFDVLVCPLSATERFLLQPFVSLPSHGTAATALGYSVSDTEGRAATPSLSIFCCRHKSHLFSRAYPAF